MKKIKQIKSELLKKNKSITLDFENYTIKGVAYITNWGGGNSYIKMDNFSVDSIDDATLMSNINDGGFGVELVNGALCFIYENYNGHLVELDGAKKSPYIVGDVPDEYIDEMIDYYYSMQYY